VRMIRTLAFCCAALLCCSWWGAAVLARSRGPAVVVALGDSVPAGTACGCTPFPALYARLLSADGRAIDLARSGAGSSDVLRQAGTPVTVAALRSASAVLLMTGANDLASVFEENGGTRAYADAAARVESHVRGTLNRYLYMRMAQLAASAACLHFHLIGPRLARWLLATQDCAQASTFRVTHEFLAYMLGVRRVGITEAAGGLQRSGLIEYNRGTLHVLDRPGLEAIACACYAADRKSYAGLL